MSTPTLSWERVYDIVFIYSWAVAAGLVIATMRGWALGLAVTVVVAALIYAIERWARATIVKSRQTQVPQRRFPTPPH